MMQSNYIKVFSAEVFHTYFQDDICRCLRFVASDATAKLGKRGFHMRNKVNGFDLYFNGMQTLAETFSYITQTTGLEYFEFNAITSDPEFTMFTDISPDWLGQLLFDSSSTSNEYANGAVVLKENLYPYPDERYVAILKIYFRDILNNQANGAPVAFEMRLNARSTQWQYYIINRSAVPLDNPAISGKSGIKFDGPENVTIQSGQRALLFSSGANLLPLSLAPKYKFDLVNTTTSVESAVKKSGQKVLFKGLPNADPKNIGIVNVNGKSEVSSPIYVYV